MPLSLYIENITTNSHILHIQYSIELDISFYLIEFNLKCIYSNIYLPSSHPYSIYNILLSLWVLENIKQLGIYRWWGGSVYWICSLSNGLCVSGLCKYIYIVENIAKALILYALQPYLLFEYGKCIAPVKSNECGNCCR